MEKPAVLEPLLDLAKNNLTDFHYKVIKNLNCFVSCSDYDCFLCEIKPTGILTRSRQKQEVA